MNSDTFSVEILPCSPNLKEKLNPLFPDKDLSGFNMSAITLSQHTQNSIMDWDENMAAEREKLANLFIEIALNTCKSLRGGDYWADFINPFTGKPVRIIFIEEPDTSSPSRYLIGSVV